jgi:hypothetical protein
VTRRRTSTGIGTAASMTGWHSWFVLGKQTPARASSNAGGLTRNGTFQKTSGSDAVEPSRTKREGLFVAPDGLVLFFCFLWASRFGLVFVYLPCSIFSCVDCFFLTCLIYMFSLCRVICIYAAPAKLHRFVHTFVEPVCACTHVVTFWKTNPPSLSLSPLPLSNYDGSGRGTPTNTWRWRGLRTTFAR